MADGEDDWMDCCDDDWSLWTRPETWAWTVLLLVQLSMVSFLIVHGRKDKSFRQAFYVFFVAVTLVDSALALLRPSREWEVTLFGTIYDKPFYEQEDPRTHEVRAYPTIRNTINKIVVHVVVPALGHAQPLFLTAIAVNRFTAFAFPLKHASMWRTRTVVVVMVSLAMGSVILGAARPVGLAIHQAVMCSRATRKQRLELGCEYDTWAFEQLLLPLAFITFTSAICCVLSFVLNVGSIAMLIALRASGRLQRKGPELQLFVHSLWMFLLQLFLAFQDLVFFADNHTYVSQDLGLMSTWADFRHSTEWLAGVNATRAWVYGDLEFTPGCAVGTAYFHDDEELPTCSAWYLLLIGELRLRERPDFTVHTLELCLFTLSGSIFLLVISGNVRNAYVDFYFKCQCSKKRSQGNGAKVFTVTARRAPTSSVTITPIISTSSRPSVA